MSGLVFPNQASGLLQNRQAVSPLIGPIGLAFQVFLDRHISIPQGARTAASASHIALREFLRGENTRDAQFPRILRTVDDDFIAGSFARHSKIWPLDDIDLYFPIDGHGLAYLQSGARLPYTLRSDGVLSQNPLMQGNRWRSELGVSSTRLLTGFSTVLQRRYPNSSIAPDGQAVKVQFTHNETEDSNGLGYDIVPCFSLDPDRSGEHRFYLIPDGQGGWLRTNPRIDTDVSITLHRRTGGRFRPAVKLVKFWNGQVLGSVFSSYFVELAIMRAFIPLNWEADPNMMFSSVLATAFGNLNRAALDGSLASWVAGAPSVSGTGITPRTLELLDIATRVSDEAVNREFRRDYTGAIQTWARLFEGFGE